MLVSCYKKAADEDRKNIRPPVIYLALSKLNMVLYDTVASWGRGGNKSKSYLLCFVRRLHQSIHYDLESLMH